jgi:hypothetical protein
VNQLVWISISQIKVTRPGSLQKPLIVAKEFDILELAYILQAY